MARVRLRFVVAAAALSLGVGPAAGQNYPDRVVRIVGGSPGGSADMTARVMAQRLSPLLGQPVLVENKPGAGGIVATEYVAKSPPDGHTLLLVNAGHATAAAIMKKLPYDSVNGFAWISMLTTYPFLIVTGSQSPFRSLADVVAAAKSAPGKVSYASTGAGYGQHMLAEWFSAETGIELLHVPFKGGSAPVTEVTTGRIDLMFDTMTLVLPHVRSGKLRALAVTSGTAASSLPDVPPAAQTVPGFAFQSWLGLAAPAGTPAPIVARLNRETRRALAEAETQKRLADLGGAATASSPEEMRAQIEREIARWRKTVESRRIERQ